MMSPELIKRLSGALRENDVLEPWLTESHWDEHYWDDVATAAVAKVGTSPTVAEIRDAVRAALAGTFGEPGPENRVYRDQFDQRLDLIAYRASA
ncbi:MAG TPA: hypothetical protein VGN51_07620 [Acidimicrobiia bacterium]|jgi:hypothetical protein